MGGRRQSERERGGTAGSEAGIFDEGSVAERVTVPAVRHKGGGKSGEHDLSLLAQ